MSQRIKQIWYCPTCGDTFTRGDRDPDRMACDNNHYAYWAEVVWDDLQDDSPLESLIMPTRIG